MAVILTCLAHFSPDAALSDPMELLDSAEAGRWSAVGRVNSAGFRSTRGCTGTLIAPSLVITAAHCAGSAPGINRKRHFVAGWHKGTFVAHRVSTKRELHPVYPFKRGTEKFAYDVALVELEEPIPTELVSPIPLAPQSDLTESHFTLMGYQNRRPHALGIHRDCDVIDSRAERWLILGCEVLNGTSGGAALVQTTDGWALSGVIVARQGPDGNAMVVSVDDWVRSAWKAALQRDAEKP
ncbi:MAG: trypsin-like serine protease [Pseudomonadota bacterium]